MLPLLLVAGAHGDTAQRRAIAAAAESQAGVTRHYDPSYVKLKYPGGDVPIERGVCADVVVRAFRKIGVDLQVSLHEDMNRDFRAYPQRWRLRGPDSNIDHRRVANLMTFFRRQRKSIALQAPYEPGDVVAWRLSKLTAAHRRRLTAARRHRRSSPGRAQHRVGDADRRRAQRV